MKEPADVVILVVGREEALGFGGGEWERGQSDWPAELARQREIEIDELAEGHTNASASGFGAHRQLPTQCTASRPPIKEIMRSAGLQPGTLHRLLCAL